MLQKVALSMILCILACLPVGAQDRSTPEATVRSFLASFAIGELKQAATCVKGAQLSGATLEALAQQVRKEPVTITISDLKTSLNGTTAVVTAQVSMKSAKSEKAQTSATQVSLAQTGGTWQIIPDAAKAQRDSEPDMVNAIAYVMTDNKVFTRARDAARATSCLSNIKQLCLGALMLAQDSDEKFSLKADAYKKSLMPYTKNEAIFKCPSDATGGISYSFNSNLAGVKMASIQAPASTIMIYEGKNGKLEFRHEGRASVGFADGHAKLVDANAAKNLRWKP